MEFKLNKEIKTFDGDSIRNVDSEIARMALTNCFNTLKELLDKDLGREELLDEFQNIASTKMLGEKLTYRQAIRSSLLQFGKGENPSEKDQLKRYELLEKLVADKVNLESAEVVDIRKAVAATYKQPIIIGRIRDLLESKDKKADQENSKKEASSKKKAKSKTQKKASG